MVLPILSIKALLHMGSITLTLECFLDLEISFMSHANVPEEVNIGKLVSGCWYRILGRCMLG